MWKNQFFRGLSVGLLLSLGSGAVSPARAAGLVNSLVLPGDLPDLSGEPAGANGNRVGFFSDLYYDRHQNVYYGLSDRGPGGGVITYHTRVQKFTLDVDPNTGAISNFNIIDTILFQRNGSNFNGLNPSQPPNNNSAVLGLSFDPEGFVVAPNGNFYVSDEYGPSLYEFTPNGEFIRTFTIPDNLLPKAGSTLNYVDGAPTLTRGRQDNRGFEGLAMTPNGSKLLAMLQDPLVNEGLENPNINNGRRSRNVRIVEFDTATGQSTNQYIYPLESRTDINDRIPGTTNDFGANSQGRNIGISAIIALNNREFLVLERDNRGLGVDPASDLPIGSKRVFKIDITGATDVKGLDLTGTNNLPAGVTPVSKTLFLDIQAALTNQIIPEKFEGLTIGPRLNDGTFALLTGTDNDYSVTQNNSNVQFNVCLNPNDRTDRVEVAITASCPTGYELIPGFLYSFKTAPGELANFVPASTTVPEPNTVMALLAVGLGSLWARGRKR